MHTARKQDTSFLEGWGGSKTELEIMQQSSTLLSVPRLLRPDIPTGGAYRLSFSLPFLWTWVVTAPRQLPTHTLAAGAASQQPRIGWSTVTTLKIRYLIGSLPLSR